MKIGPENGVSNLRLTLTEAALYFIDLFFYFSVSFFKFCNSPQYTADGAVCFDIKQFTYFVKIFAPDLT